MIPWLLCGFLLAVICFLCWLILRCDGSLPPIWWVAFQKRNWWRKP